jgi:hypothetical protein
MNDDWQQRLIVEKRELDEKIKKLNAFINTPEWKALNSKDQSLMVHHAAHMYSYSGILGERIQAISKVGIIS